MHASNKGGFDENHEALYGVLKMNSSELKQCRKRAEEYKQRRDTCNAYLHGDISVDRICQRFEDEGYLGDIPGIFDFLQVAGSCTDLSFLIWV